MPLLKVGGTKKSTLSRMWQMLYYIPEIVVYPIMDDLMGEEAKEITEKDRDSHQRIKEVRVCFRMPCKQAKLTQRTVSKHRICILFRVSL